MILHPQIIVKDGKSEFVVLPYEEYVILQEMMENYEDLRDLRAAKAESANEPGIPLADAIKELEV